LSGKIVTNLSFYYKKCFQDERNQSVICAYAEPIEVDPTGCINVYDFIKKAQKKFQTELDDCSLAQLNLHRYTGTKLEGDMKIAELVKPPFHNDINNPLLIRYAVAVPIVKKLKKLHPSEERRKRWEELNDILIRAEIDDAKKENVSLNWESHFSCIWTHYSPIFSTCQRNSSRND
jgi:hypothetical protein